MSLRALAAMSAACVAMSAAAAELRLDVGSNDNPVYEKECGSCHFAYQPGWLPERSWRKLMASLGSHFGDNAELPAATRDSLTAYLASRAADRSSNARSRDIVRTIPPGETPVSITKVLYVGGIHGGFLDPHFRGTPQVKTLAQCPVCHRRAQGGWFSQVTYTVSDESFRTNDVDMDASLPVPSWMRIGR